MNEPVVEFRDVCFSYNGQEVLHNVSLEIPEHAMAAVVGPNAGGKSTMLKLALGLLKPRFGQVRVFGKPPETARRRIGYVPQTFEFDSSFPITAGEVVLMGRIDRHWGGPFWRSDRRAVDQALDRVDMLDRKKRHFAQLSGGERQRILIAQALVSEPDLLLLDEPTSDVDARVEARLYELLHELNEHLTIVLVSHNLTVVTRHASHIICINRISSIHRAADMTSDQLHTACGDRLAVLHHEDSCQVIDPSERLSEPHAAERH